MLTEKAVRDFADHWLQAWNSHDLHAIMSHYASDVTLVSPAAAKLLNIPNGMVIGNADVRAYFAKGLDAYPDLQFVLIDLMWGLSSVVLYYSNQRGTRTGEFMEFNAAGKVVRVVANYSG